MQSVMLLTVRTNTTPKRTTSSSTPTSHAPDQYSLATPAATSRKYMLYFATFLEVHIQTHHFSCSVPIILKLT